MTEHNSNNAAVASKCVGTRMNHYLYFAALRVHNRNADGNKCGFLKRTDFEPAKIYLLDCSIIIKHQ